MVRVAASVTDNVLTITVSDQGSGISEEHHSRIFEPFFTTKSGLKNGLGYGLPISRSIVKSMGGTISFESKVGCGTVFCIMLPLGSEKGMPE